MELKRHLNLNFIFVGIYCLAFLTYLFFGLQPAEAVREEYDTTLLIPSIGLNSAVRKLELNNRELDTPDTIVGSFSNHDNKTLLIGHSTTVFSHLNNVKVGDLVYYNKTLYKITESTVLKKQEINMAEVLSESEHETLIIMTCAGELLDEGDATHRLIVEAVRLV